MQFFPRYATAARDLCAHVSVNLCIYVYVAGMTYVCERWNIMFYIYTRKMGGKVYEGKFRAVMETIARCRGLF